MKKLHISIPLCVALLLGLALCQGCQPATAAIMQNAIEAEDGTIDIESEHTLEPVHTPDPNLVRATPQPTPSPSPEPTPAPTVQPTPKPTPKPTEKPKKTKAPEKTDAPAATSAPLQFIPATPAPAAVTPATTPAASGGSDSSAIQTIFALTNQQRAANGASALKESSALRKAAATRAQEISVSFSHTRPDGTSALSISSAAYAENIAYGLNMSHEAIMQGWMNSPGHRTNILNPSYATIGVGVYAINGYVYYVQLFGY